MMPPLVGFALIAAVVGCVFLAWHHDRVWSRRLDRAGVLFGIPRMDGEPNCDYSHRIRARLVELNGMN